MAARLNEAKNARASHSKPARQWLLHTQARSQALITVRMSLGSLRRGHQEEVVQTIAARAECDAISASLQRIYVIESASDLEVEFWFQGCAHSEASQRAAAAIRDAAAEIANRHLDAVSTLHSLNHAHPSNLQGDEAEAKCASDLLGHLAADLSTPDPLAQA
jgi:hypothetical protein